MLKRKYTNCLNFEHTYFITEPYVDYLLSKNGFRLIEKQYFKKDHSIFFAYVNCNSVLIHQKGSDQDLPPHEDIGFPFNPHPIIYNSTRKCGSPRR